MNSKKLLTILLVLSVTLVSCVSTGGAPKSVELIGDPSVELTDAEIYNVNPKVVRPGTLMSVSGAGFGENPGVINLGGVDITTYLGWSDSTIWFRVPEGIEQDAELMVGYEYAEELILTAPEDSITVKWVIDMVGTQAMVDKRYTQFDLPEPPKMTAPLHVKGQWFKGGETYGMKDEGWDGGSRQVMYNIPGTDLWEVEAVFTPEAVESYGRSMMAFAVEDGDDEFRNLSTFESDFAFIVKKKWASGMGLSNDPAVKISEENRSFDAASRTIIVQYPIPQ